ncbi:MAG: hypothetical protein IJZ26_00780 [Clostridia bacterium]|nr:hypothetical protein [Clostridia bacterium]
MNSKMSAIVQMQLKDKLDLSFLKSKKKTISKIVFFILTIAAVAVVTYLMLYMASLFRIFSFSGIVPTNVIVTVLIIILLLSLFSCTYGLMKSLYFSYDNQVLLTLPVSPSKIFLSKIIVYYIYELIKNTTFLLPILFAYGFFSSMDTAFYFWAIFMLFFVSALPVTIGALLSIPAMYIANLLKKYNWLKIVLFALIIGGLVWAVVAIIGAIPENINFVQNLGSIQAAINSVLAKICEIFSPIVSLFTLICGAKLGGSPYFTLFGNWTIINFAILLGVLVATLGLAILLAKPLFLKMASKPFEFKKKDVSKQINNVKTSKFKSMLKKEARVGLRDSEYLVNILSVLIILPIAILLLNKLYSAMSTKLLGQLMIYSFNILIMLLVLLSTNGLYATLLSKEGRAKYLRDAEPLNRATPILTKLIIPFVVGCVSIIISCSIFNSFVHLSAINFTLLLVGIITIYGGHMLWCIEFDALNAQNEQYATTGNNLRNPNEIKATVSAFILSLVGFLGTLFLFMEDMNSTFIKFAIIGVAFMVWRLFSFFQKTKYLHLQK